MICITNLPPPKTSNLHLMLVLIKQRRLLMNTTIRFLKSKSDLNSLCTPSSSQVLQRVRVNYLNPRYLFRIHSRTFPRIHSPRKVRVWDLRSRRNPCRKKRKKRPKFELIPRSWSNILWSKDSCSTMIKTCCKHLQVKLVRLSKGLFRQNTSRLSIR